MTKKSRDEKHLLALSGLPFGIGSMPNEDPVSTCEMIVENFPESPFWPELPQRSWRESMGVEQARDLPGMVTDEKNGRVFFDTTKDISGDLEVFYNSYLDDDISKYAISGEFLSGLDAMITTIKRRGLSPLVLKGQLTGPTTLGLILKDQNNKALLFNEQMMDVLTKATAMKAKWLVRLMEKYCEVPIVFFDEPMLQSIGSASVPIDNELAIKRLKEIIDSVDCLTGGHCCGNTDWSILMAAGNDIIAFDAWSYLDTITLYAKELKDFIENDGFLAWGIIPASAEGASVSVDELKTRLRSGFSKVALKTGLTQEILAKHSIITPGCGLGSLSEDQARIILEKTSEIAGKILDT